MKHTDRPEDRPNRKLRGGHHSMPGWGMALLFLAAFGIFAYYTSGLFVLLLISGITAYLLSSVINRMEYYGIKRSVAVAAIYITAALLLALADLIFLPCLTQETKTLSEKLPEITRQTEEALAGLRGYPYAEGLVDKIMSVIADPMQTLTGIFNVTDIFSHAASIAFGLVLVPFFVFFILRDWPIMLRTIMNIMPSEYVETSVAILSEINTISGNYLRGLAIDCLVVGALATSGLWMLGIGYPVTLGLLTGAANVIPYIGPVISCLAACSIAFVQIKSPAAIINVALLYISIKLIDDFVVQPLSIGRSVKLHPMLLVISIIAAQKLFGILGMVLAVPAVTIIQKIILIYFERKRISAGSPAAIRQTHEIIV